MYDWLCLYTAYNDQRLGVKVGNLISANDGDVCIAALLTEILPTLNSPVCFDVGADEGWWSLFVKSLSPTAKIFAFEPNPTSVSLCKENLKNTDVILIENAVSDEEKVISFDFSGPSSNSRGTGTHQVACVPLTKYMKDKDLVIKIDTEGHDMVIVKSLLHTLDTIHTLIFEFTIYWYENKDEVVGMIQFLCTQFPNCYELSRRGMPKLVDIRKMDIPQYLYQLFIHKMQIDLCFTRHSIQSIPILTNNHT